jgi:hypothetical protein
MKIYINRCNGLLFSKVQKWRKTEKNRGGGRQHMEERYKTDYESGPYGCTTVLLCTTKISGSSNDYKLKRDTNNKDLYM